MMPTLKHIFLTLALCTAMVFPSSVFAATNSDTLAITLTPPLFQVTQSPGTDWKSLLRVVNSNPYDITVNVKIQDFHPDGETGNPQFEEIPKSAPGDPHRMSGWIDAPTGNITITHSTTAEIPFTVHVPEGADPGGHYAAIIVGTVAAQTQGSGSGVSSAIGSLIFLRVPGEVVEKGVIRDFYALSEIAQNTDETFIMRFENQGNVHLIPQGNIEITNMWGKVRGKMEINQSNTFGNVLPSSTRKFEFRWQGESSPFEVGRYKAVAALVYGQDGRQTVYRTVYFWIVPWKPVAMILGGIFLFFWFISWSVRRYIKNALAFERQWMEANGMHVPLAGAVKNNDAERNVTKPAREKETAVMTFATLKRPLTLSAVDMRAGSSARKVQASTKKTATGSQAKQISPRTNGSVTLTKWLKHNRRVVFFMAIVIVGFSLIGWYFVEVFQNERSYHIEQIRPK